MAAWWTKTGRNLRGFQAVEAALVPEPASVHELCDVSIERPGGQLFPQRAQWTKLVLTKLENRAIDEVGPLGPVDHFTPLPSSAVPLEDFSWDWSGNPVGNRLGQWESDWRFPLPVDGPLIRLEEGQDATISPLDSGRSRAPPTWLSEPIQPQHALRASGRAEADADLRPAMLGLEARSRRGRRPLHA